jgi:hypothetical protein
MLPKRGRSSAPRNPSEEQEWTERQNRASESRQNHFWKSEEIQHDKLVRSTEVEPSSKDSHLALGAGNKLPIERKNESAAYPNLAAATCCRSVTRSWQTGHRSVTADRRRPQARRSGRLAVIRFQRSRSLPEKQRTR